MADHTKDGAAPTVDGSPSPISAHHPEKTAVSRRDTSDSEAGHEPKPHLHAKTFLAIFAVCVIYFTQIYNLVGAGAVSIAQLPAICLTLAS
ncbi:hypothetical protein QBC46DRAFT_85809 [Diplogelasinospora grovesii]|uniref:Uncharacterized protein n=1 Tax=Diplogelasinospora grovesii TaxID=303347 RepID=A0AAN6MVD1_9PEZI|nr:hypothetical protein QBC46DRAFT_85809 [Diplogelasinospora grovesii]